ncbi:hypothetical protein A2U01_0093294 [Trifolium medium]|uniref:Uncharacterized protein n=1 Tax=Trifolium medium TaxID=97028 RepID=A0A392UES4_9FABA|nr:hypothetical protein [Trifolium medium]
MFRGCRRRHRREQLVRGSVVSMLAVGFIRRPLLHMVEPLCIVRLEASDELHSSRLYLARFCSKGLGT